MERYLTEFNTERLKTVFTDTVIVGSGLAGLTVALELDRLNVDYLVVSKGDIKVSNSFLAQGGIAAALSLEDSPKAHFKDTLKAGKGLCIEESVKILVDEGLQRVVELIGYYKVQFDRDEDRIPILTREGAHSKKRILHYKDKTGKAILEKLYSFVNKDKVLIGFEVEEILTDEEENRFLGVILKKDKEKIVIFAKSIVLATGGYSAVYSRNTSAYKINGDILGLALRTGLVLKDLEFIQFHPTAFYSEKNEQVKLISEAVRGEGAILVDDKGERFIDELKPRDEVARAIFNRYLEGRKVYLDISPIIKKGVNFQERFPTIYKVMKDNGLENSTKIPVSPAAHYSIGGIETNSYGETGINGIFAVGEVACTGINGANRLASNSLLECLVFGYRTAFSVYKYNLHTDRPRNIKLENRLDTCRELSQDKINLVLKKLKNIMWEKVGLIREENLLNEALNDINYIEKEINSYHNTRYIKDLIFLAKGIIISAINRKESRGAHYRKDFPRENEIYKKHTKVYNNFKIKMEVS